MTATRVAGSSASGRATLTPVSFRKGRAHAPRLSTPYVPGRRSARFWTDEEEAILRRHFPAGGAIACGALLPARGVAAIYLHANKLGLRAPKVSARARVRRGGGFDEAIRAAWPALKGRGAVRDLAARLGVPRWWLSQRASALGLAIPHRKEPPWTAAEDALLPRVPLHDPSRSARIFREHGFRRTPAAIVMRCKRLEISRRWRDTLSAYGAAAILGCDARVVSAWCVAGDLAAARRGTRRLPQQGGDAWSIEPAELRRFVLANLERIDIRKVEKFAFVKLLAGEDLA